MSIDSDLYFSSISAVLGPVEFRANLNDYDHVTDSGIIAQLLADNDFAAESSAIDLIQERYVASVSAHIESFGPFPTIHGATQFVDRLRDSKEHKVAISTGGWKGSAILKLEASGIDVNRDQAANRSVAQINSCTMPGSLLAWPASPTSRRSASGQAL